MGDWAQSLEQLVILPKSLISRGPFLPGRVLDRNVGEAGVSRRGGAGLLYQDPGFLVGGQLSERI